MKVLRQGLPLHKPFLTHAVGIQELVPVSYLLIKPITLLLSQSVSPTILVWELTVGGMRIGSACHLSALAPAEWPVSMAEALPPTALPEPQQFSLAAPTFWTNFRVGFQLWLDFSV
jgi:hypothetical protein